MHNAYKNWFSILRAKINQMDTSFRNTKHTNIDEMVCFMDHLCLDNRMRLSSRIQIGVHTGILNAMLCEHAMAPVANAAHDLDTAGTVGRRRKGQFDFHIVTEMKSLSEAMSHVVEPLQVGMACVLGQP